MTLDASLLSILACPEDKGPLYYFAADGFLFNPRLSRKYLVRDGIPVMLIEEAVSVEATERDALMRRISDEGIAPTFTG
jgi:uncharacterized protein YbaR (Trm112 family)